MRSLATHLRLEVMENRLVLSVYYVAPNGNDGFDGSSQHPWQTLQHAADGVGAGDTVIVRAGAYRGFDLRNSGDSGAPITFSADPGVFITSAEAQRNRDGINLEDFSGAIHDVVIDGFNINGLPEAGIRAVGVPYNHASTIWILNNHCDSNGSWGIFTGFVDDLLIQGNETSRSVREHGIYVSNTSYRPVVRLNVSWGNHSNGIHFNGDLSEGDAGIISGALVERNVIFDNGAGGGSGINCDGVQNSIFQNNLLYNNHASGISLYDIDAAAGSIDNIVVNNTIIVAANGRWAINIQNGSTGNTLLNNILYNYHSYRGSINISLDSLLGFTSDFNVVMNRFTPDDGDTILNLSLWQQLTGQDFNSIIATPDELFVDPAGGDFHLLPTSPAIGMGTGQFAPKDDLDGNSRPSDSGWDIGAYQYVSTSPRGSIIHSWQGIKPAELAPDHLQADILQALDKWFDHAENQPDGLFIGGR
ncbi:MAG TPA: right-handed parallel beta-helix repeat-containing protein [Gemmataceae bacterium]|jgi:hypothetical protein|nr:right-handed parallel beta-helix repeat-containing protein [Gemmataceae bacterium]